jgi:hypothetical protein
MLLISYLAKHSPDLPTNNKIDFFESLDVGPYLNSAPHSLMKELTSRVVAKRQAAGKKRRRGRISLIPDPG